MKVSRLLSLLLVLGLAAGGFVYGQDLLTTGLNSTNGDAPPEKTARSSTNASAEQDNNKSIQPSENEEKAKESSEAEDENLPYDRRKARVVEVFDGDTFKVRFLDSEETATIRLQGIDCPESSTELDKCWSDEDLIDIPCKKQVPLGKRAGGYARALLEGDIVGVESYKDFKKGYYGRTIAYIRTPSGEDYGLKMVKKGYCKDSGIRYDHPRDDVYKKHRRGIKR